MQIEHEGDQGTLQLRARAVQHVEARSGDLGAALEVDDAEGRAEVPVRHGREVELPRFADGLEQHIVIVAGARAACEGRECWGRWRWRRSSFDIDRGDLLIKGRDVIAQLPHGVDLAPDARRRP